MVKMNTDADDMDQLLNRQKHHALCNSGLELNIVHRTLVHETLCTRSVFLSVCVQQSYDHEQGVRYYVPTSDNCDMSSIPKAYFTLNGHHSYRSDH